MEQQMAYKNTNKTDNFTSMGIYGIDYFSALCYSALWWLLLPHSPPTHPQPLTNHPPPPVGDVVDILKI